MFRCCRRAGAVHAQVCGWPRSAGRQLLSRLGRHAALSCLAHSPLQCQSSSSSSGAGRTTSSRASSASSQYTAALQAGRQIDALHNISTTPFLAACRCEYTKASCPKYTLLCPHSDMPRTCCPAAARGQSARRQTTPGLDLWYRTASSACAAPSGSQSCTWASASRAWCACRGWGAGGRGAGAQGAGFSGSGRNTRGKAHPAPACSS